MPGHRIEFFFCNRRRYETVVLMRSCPVVALHEIAANVLLSQRCRHVSHCRYPLRKKGRRVLCQEPQVKYAFMRTHATHFSIQAMCRVLGIARSGYYAWCSRRTSMRHWRRAELDGQVAQAYNARKGRSGAPRLYHDLREAGLRCNRKTVAASMQRQELRAKAAKKFKATTNSQHSLPVAENLLKQDFTASAPNQKWVGDITYLHTEECWLYLAAVIDLYSRMVIGWAMSERMTADLVCDALHMALWRRRQPKGVIVHSDRGSQYCSAAYRELIPPSVAMQHERQRQLL